MKKFNYLIGGSILIYLILAFVSGNAILSLSQQQFKAHRVEINRLLNEINSPEDIKTISLSSYQYVYNIEYLDHAQNKEQTEYFFNTNKDSFEITPLYQNNELLGYIKFNYLLPNSNLMQMMIIGQMSLFILELCMIIYLCYLKKHLFKPFQQVSELPAQLAMGHFKGTIKEEKSKYFNHFLLGMGQLKDTLEVSNKRQLELMREKKKMLLSLSHDIKTPLNLIKLYDQALIENLYENSQEKENAMLQIKEKTEEIEQYVNQIIKSSREDLFDLEVHNEDFYLQDLIDNILTVYKEQCVLRQIELTVNPFVNRLLKGDKERSQEVLENLFENAFKYGDGRKIEITFYEEDYCQLIRFYNSGQVVQDNEFNHLFESFFRASNATGKAGNGLGLYICHELMHKMDGDIFAEKLEDGMAFTLVFR